MSEPVRIASYLLCPVHGQLVGVGGDLHLVESCPACQAEAVEAEARIERAQRRQRAAV